MHTSSDESIPCEAVPCEAVPFVDETSPLPVAYHLPDAPSAGDAPVPFTTVLTQLVVTLTACEGITNILALALDPAPPVPETLLCVVCPWIGCFGAWTRDMMYLAIYLVYALHVFMWRLWELVWLTHAPLGHAVTDDTRVVTTGDVWTLQLLVLLVLVRGWVAVCVWWLVQSWLRS